jgi:hypothetical protein
MKTKLLLLAIIIFSVACKKDLKTDCAPVSPVCNDTVPTGEFCQAFFTRWFYDKESKSCKQVGYSGCSQKGFATQTECEACKCK